MILNLDERLKEKCKLSILNLDERLKEMHIFKNINFQTSSFSLAFLRHTILIFSSLHFTFWPHNIHTHSLSATAASNAAFHQLWSISIFYKIENWKSPHKSYKLNWWTISTIKLILIIFWSLHDEWICNYQLKKWWSVQPCK